jgi:arylsulfatase A-like enzyme
MNRRCFLRTVVAGAGVLSAGSAFAANGDKPNFIIIFTDDQGYNDLGCFGSETIKTPRIDRLAEEGMKLTSFYAQTVCGPSRGALMTGRYPVRIGGGWTTNGDEITVAEVLKEAGYATGCIGKWDMSKRRYQEGLVPNDQGFDYYYGTLGANDRGSITFYRNREQLDTTSDMGSLTKLYTDEAIQFIKEKKDQPFFLYLAHTMAHVVVDASPQFKGKSNGELYGDVIEEIDWNVGRVVDKVTELGLADNTYILFFSDNGPWSGKEDIYRKTHGGQLATGSAKPLRSGKGSAYEGGFREPCVMWAPGRIPAGRESGEIVSTMDIMPTLAALAGAAVPTDRVIDGHDQTGLLTGKSEKSDRTTFYYHIRGELHAVRRGRWKLMLPDRTRGYDFTGDPKVTVPELYDLDSDISETHNVAEEHPDLVRELLVLATRAPNLPDHLNVPAAKKKQQKAK